MSLFVVNSSVSPPPTSTASASSALLDAVTPASLARVTVTQQTPQQLSLRLANGSQVTMDPSGMTDSTMKSQYRTGTLNDSNQTVGLFRANQSSQSVAISDNQLNRLTDQITRVYTTAANAQLSVKAQVTAVRPDAVTLQLNNGHTLTVPVRLSPTHIGEQVALDLTRHEGKATLSLKGANAQSTVTASLTGPDKTVIRDVVNAALRNAGISLDAKAVKPLAEPLAALVPKPPGQGQTIQNQITVSEKGGKLNVQSATLQAVGRFSVSSNVSADALGRIDSALIDKSTLNRLPMLNVSDPGATKAMNPSATLSAQQRSDVHQQIITLSRQLLSETGSTRTALNQLLTALDMPVKGASPATQTLMTMLQTRVRGLEQGVSFSSFTPQLKSEKEASAVALQGNVSNNNADAKAGLFGNMTQRMKDLAALLSQPSTLQEAGEATLQNKPASAATPLPQNTAEQVKALLNAAPLPLSQAVLSRPSGGNDLVGALVTMLQFSLAGRAINRQPSLARQADRGDSILSKSLAGSSGGQSGSPSRVAQDMTQMDSRSSLVQSLKTLLSNHQQAALTNADNRLQGQDSLYYMLPMTGSSSAPPELLIRRDQSDHQQSNEQEASARSWHLTMKLDIGGVGELLAKSRIQGETIELDLYASSDPLLHMVADSLVYFTRKLEANGLEVSRASFQRGKVPTTLRDQPHHIFETMV